MHRILEITFSVYPYLIAILTSSLSEMISNDEILPDADLGWKNSSRHSVKGLKINE